MSDLKNFDLTDLRIEDGQIVGVVDGVRHLEVRFVDFAEDMHLLIFEGVLRYDGFSPCGTDLGGAFARQESDFLEETCVLLSEDRLAYKHFEFVSAWDGTPILRIIAAAVELRHV